MTVKVFISYNAFKKTFVVEMFYISICFYYVIAQQWPSPAYAITMSLY